MVREARRSEDGDGGEGPRGEAQIHYQLVEEWVVLLKERTPEERRLVHEAIHRLDGGQPNRPEHREVPRDVGGVQTKHEMKQVGVMCDNHGFKDRSTPPFCGVPCYNAIHPVFQFVEVDRHTEWNDPSARLLDVEGLGAEGCSHYLTDEVWGLVLMLRHQVNFGAYMQLSTDTVRKLVDAITDVYEIVEP